MLAIYEQGVGRRRCDLHRDVQRVFEQEADCPLRRMQAFCKLLDEQSEYSESERRGAAELRRTVFRQAAARHPLVSQADTLFEHDVETVRREIAAGLNRSWEDVRDGLFADVITAGTAVAVQRGAGPGGVVFGGVADGGDCGRFQANSAGGAVVATDAYAEQSAARSVAD
jgi:hypothetical protein